MSKVFSKISSKLIKSNPYWNYRLDKYVLPTGTIGDYHYVDSRGSTIVIPILNETQFLITSQFRYLNSKESLEFPGGGLSPNLTFEENALIELEEETGFIAGKLEFLGEFNPFNGVTNEICKVYLASDLSESIQKPNESEDIKVIKCTLDDINNWIISNKIWDGMSIAAYIMFYLKYIQR
jgi:ADP-ribose pyrophosphatase